MTPTTTVVDKLFVQMAIISVGRNAATTGQLRVTNEPSVFNKFSTTKALKIQIGMNDNHFNTTSGNFTLRTKIKGIILGSQVTTAQPTIIQIIVFVLIDQSPPQPLRQLLLKSALLNEMA